jgi:nitrogen fixation/metabolism regulation signal transduction histidine kinase
MLRHKRKQLFVDNKVQGALTLRVVAYWFYCLLTVALMTACWVILSETPQSSREMLQRVWAHAGPALLSSLLLLPIVVVDAIRLSNRFAGPVLRLRRGMKQLADGQSVSPIHFRDGDFWCDFALDFNRVASRVQAAAERELDEASQSDSAFAEQRYEEPVGAASRFI